MNTQTLLRIGAAALFVLGTASYAAADTIPVNVPAGYCLVWHDEFENDGALDPKDWAPEEGFVRNREWQWYQGDNAYCRDGLLVITARRESRPNPCYKAESKHWAEQRKDIECTSASMTTRGRHEFLYGRFEVRARIPAARGSWPAIWFLGVNQYGWPCNGEVDLMEFYPKGGTRSILANACWGGENGRSKWDSAVIPFTHWTSRDSLWATQFHTWRMDWDEDFIRLYLDDELLNEIDLSKTVNAEGSPAAGFNPFHSPMYLLLNLAMGSSGGKVDEAALPMHYEVDYVRVFQTAKP